MTDLRTELVRNLVGLILILSGMIVTGVGAHWHVEKMVDAGLAFFPAALLALQVKRDALAPKE